jgi:hypothetical protein
LVEDAGLLRQRRRLRQAGEALLLRHAQVGEVVADARRHDEVELVGLRLDRPLGAAQVRHQRAVDDAGRAADLAQHDLGVAQLRDRLRRDERRHLDLDEAGVGQAHITSAIFSSAGT